MSEELDREPNQAGPPHPDANLATAAPTPDAAAVAPTSAPSTWWRIADFGVLGLWIAVVGFTLHYHEKWLDEAQAWLFARDLDLRTLWFYELRYEGSPGLWHTILWVAQHVFHARYDLLGPIGAVCALAGAALLIFKAPFPRYIRWPLAFTYFLVYQYAVIARQYTLLPLFAFAAAALFKDREHPERMTLVLVLLANVSFHGTVLAGCFGLAYLIEAFPSWRALDSRIRTRYWICAGVMVVTFVFVYFVVKPAPDSLEIVRKPGLFHLPEMVNQQGQSITPALRFTSVISGAFLDYLVPSVIFLLLSAAWCFLRRRLLLFAVPVALEIGIYTFVYGVVHHQGTVFLAALAGLWIAWPKEDEQRAFGPFERRATQAMAGLLLCLCVVNIWDSVVVIKREYLYPYSGAEDAANYLKGVGADHQTIFGYGWIGGVQPYFDHNIMGNIPTSYTHNGLPAYGMAMNAGQIELQKPGYLVIDIREDPQEALKRIGPGCAMEGYDLVHFSDGYYLYKRGVYEREAYFIFRRMRDAVWQTPSQPDADK